MVNKIFFFSYWKQLSITWIFCFSVQISHDFCMPYIYIKSISSRSCFFLHDIIEMLTFGEVELADDRVNTYSYLSCLWLTAVASMLITNYLDIWFSIVVGDCTRFSSFFCFLFSFFGPFVENFKTGNHINLIRVAFYAIWDAAFSPLIRCSIFSFINNGEVYIFYRVCVCFVPFLLLFRLEYPIISW